MSESSATPDAPGLDDLYAAFEREERAGIVAAIVFSAFDAYYRASRAIPHQVQAAFEARDWPETLRLSRERLSVYARAVAGLAPDLAAAAPELARDAATWSLIEAAYRARIADRYEADLAFAFLSSIRRDLCAEPWRPVSYAEREAPGLDHPGSVLTRLSATVPVRPADVQRMLAVGGLRASWRDLAADARLVGLEITRALLRRGLKGGDALAIDMVEAGFFRDRGAALVGRIEAGEGPPLPLMIMVLHGRDGLFVDAVLTEGDDLQYAFSSTLANFHVTNPRYHELAAFLHGLMPRRPIGTHYSTIGFNHVGKGAVMREILAEHARTGERLDTAAGFRGTVAIGFSMPSSRYVMKIIRDRPTSGYKWGHFPGVRAVLDKYDLVHGADRAGSMLDNILYTNASLPADLFAPALLDELLEAGAGTVSRHGDAVLFGHLIAQMKMTPLPLFLETASSEEAVRAVLNLGDCIKNNAAANLFNRDLDGRNYGVSAVRRVFLFDYDAVEPLTNVKIRTNLGREDGEEGIPDWYFEEGTVFLPEEMMTGLRLDDPALRRTFREAHAELLTVDYWEGMQRALGAGKVPRVRSYPPGRRLHRHALRTG
ncbi:isocitrate dehydrogenase kinase/phosphatase AceK regulatory subunit [Methylobacterium sp. A54F]